jgi:hypothetical protein
VCGEETSKNEGAKARYRAVENTNTVGCNAKKTNSKCIVTIISSITLLLWLDMLLISLATLANVNCELVSARKGGLFYLLFFGYPVKIATSNVL